MDYTNVKARIDRTRGETTATTAIPHVLSNGLNPKIWGYRSNYDRVTYYVDGVVNGTITGTSTDYMYTLRLPGDGQYTVSASVFGLDGVLLFSTLPFQLTVDTHLDYTLDTKVASGNQANAGRYLGNDVWALPPNTAHTLTFNGTIEEGGSVSVSNQNATVEVVGTHYSVTYHAPDGATVSGTQTLRLDYADSAGNTATKNLMFTVDDGTNEASISSMIQTDHAIKTIQIAEGVWRTQDARPQFSGTAELGSSVQILMNGRVIGNASVTEEQWSFVPSSPLPVGQHVFSARSVNIFGQETQTTKISVTIDPLTATVSMNHWDIDHDSAHPQYTTTPGHLMPTTYLSSSDTLSLSGSVLPTPSHNLDTIARVEIYDRQIKVGNATLNGLDWSFSVARARAGDHLYSAKLISHSGAVIDSTEAMPFTLVSHLAGADYPWHATPTTPRLQGNAKSNAYLLTPDSARNYVKHTEHASGGGGFDRDPATEPVSRWTTTDVVTMPWNVHTEAGNDLLVISAAAPLNKYYGDSGFDTLRIDSPNTPVTYQITGNLIGGVERIDLSTTGKVTLNLTSADVPGLATRVLAISGGQGDVIHLQDAGATHFDRLGTYHASDLAKLGKSYQAVVAADLAQGREAVYSAYMVNLGAPEQTRIQDEFLLLVNIGVESDLNGIHSPLLNDFVSGGSGRFFV